MTTGDSYLSDLHHLGEILSESSQLNLVGVQQTYNTDNMNISDVDEANSESGDSTATQVDIFGTKPIKFASIANEDIVELSAVEDDLVIWVRATKCDALYERILVQVNKLTKNVDNTIKFLEEGDVILVKYSGDYSRGIVKESFHLERDAEVSVQLIDIGVSFNIDPSM